MTITERILDIIELKPDLTAETIRQVSEAKKQTVKQTLWRLNAKGLIHRKKINLPSPQGPQSVYVYRIGEQDGN
jgi:predicted transcriptional regulator